MLVNTLLGVSGVNEVRTPDVPERIEDPDRASSPPYFTILGVRNGLNVYQISVIVLILTIIGDLAS